MHKKLPHLQQELVNRKGPVFHHDSTQPRIAQPMLQNLGYKVLPHLPLSPDLSCQTLTTASPSVSFWQFFWGGRENTLQLARGRKCFPRFLKSWLFMLQELTNLFIVGKIVLIVMDSILVNKDMLEPSYDLKSQVWNSNYFCTNLIFIRVLLMASTKLTAWFCLGLPSP